MLPHRAQASRACTVRRALPCDKNDVRRAGKLVAATEKSGHNHTLCAVALNGAPDLFAGGDTDTHTAEPVGHHIGDQNRADKGSASAVGTAELLIQLQRKRLQNESPQE